MELYMIYIGLVALLSLFSFALGKAANVAAKEKKFLKSMTGTSFKVKEDIRIAPKFSGLSNSIFINVVENTRCFSAEMNR